MPKDITCSYGRQPTHTPKHTSSVFWHVRGLNRRHCFHANLLNQAHTTAHGPPCCSLTCGLRLSFLRLFHLLIHPGALRKLSAMSTPTRIPPPTPGPNRIHRPREDNRYTPYEPVLFPPRIPFNDEKGSRSFCSAALRTVPVHCLSSDTYTRPTSMHKNRPTASQDGRVEC